jgi:SAM-dependent methyltransferase
MTETFQITAEQAEVYESKFVPALFADWAPALLDAVDLQPGQRVLDVACGTGVLARTAASRGCDVVGLDLNEGMLTVARRLRPDITWRQGDVMALPFDDGAFDVVLCQSALMFFPDVVGALREMARVSAGVVGVQVYASLADQPAYGPFVELVARHAGPSAVELLGTYWVHGDLDALRDRFAAAGMSVTFTSRTGAMHWDSIEDMVRTEVSSTPLISRISPSVLERIATESRSVLGRFRPDAIPIAGHLAVGKLET